jgi:hypothetical protein
MRKADVIEFFGGTEPATAAALGVTKQAVHGWGEIVPEGIAYKVQVISKNKLLVDPKVYAKIKQKRLAA